MAYKDVVTHGRITREGKKPFGHKVGAKDDAPAKETASKPKPKAPAKKAEPKAETTKETSK